MKVSLYTDGGARGNPGNAGAGVLIKTNDGDYEFFKYLGIRTNNEAEYLALCYGLQLLLERNLYNVDVYLDSELIVKQLNGIYKVKNERLLVLYNKVKELQARFKNISFKHIKREQNKVADKLVNKAIDTYLNAKEN